MLLTCNDPRDPRSRTTAVTLLALNEPSDGIAGRPQLEAIVRATGREKIINKYRSRAKISIEQTACTGRKERYFTSCGLGLGHPLI
jgi:hypothetical protein